MPAPADADERARLVGAAWTVLERSGFEGFKIQLLLRETGLSARTFYRHFPDKEALLLTLLADEYARSGARLRRALVPSSPPEARVAAWIREIVGAAEDPRRAARARMFTSVPRVLRRFPDEVDAAARVVIEPLEAAIRDGRDDGTLPLGDPQRDAQLIHDLAGAVMARALADPGGGSVDALSATVIDFALRALGHLERGSEPLDER